MEGFSCEPRHVEDSWEPPELGRVKERPSLKPPEATWPCQHLHLASSLQDCGRSSFCCFKLPCLVICYSGTVQELVKVSSNDLVMLTGERMGKKTRFSSQHHIAKAGGLPHQSHPDSLFKIQIPGGPPCSSE